jgi:DNA-binding SARP family transcriptional activator
MLQVQLFGKLRVQDEGRLMGGLDGRRVQELLVYLLLHRERSHPREYLADLMWGEGTSAQLRKGLRQTLWKLQAVLGAQDEPGCCLLRVDPKYVQLNSEADLWLDVADFEGAWQRALGTPGAELDGATAAALRKAVQLYRGDLLDGWYQDWCLLERERLRSIYLDMLVKLMAHAEACQDYESGLEYGSRVLQLDPARERTHRIMMRLHYRSGSRVEAIRQFERCEAALRDEIGVAPSRRTALLYEALVADSLAGPEPPRRPIAERASAEPASLAGVLAQLHDIRQALGDLQGRVEHQIDLLEHALPEMQ